MDAVTGEGSGELMEDRSLEVTSPYQNGEGAMLKTKQLPTSTSC